MRLWRGWIARLQIIDLSAQIEGGNHELMHHFIIGPLVGIRAEVFAGDLQRFSQLPIHLRRLPCAYNNSIHASQVSTESGNVNERRLKNIRAAQVTVNADRVVEIIVLLV